MTIYEAMTFQPSNVAMTSLLLYKLVIRSASKIVFSQHIPFIHGFPTLSISPTRNLMPPQSLPSHLPIGIIFLAAGYGTRLSRDISKTPSLALLFQTPKPLLPLSGHPILTHWLRQIPPSYIVVVTNAAHHSLYLSWADNARQQHQGQIVVISDGTTNNSNRLGAVADISIGLEALRKTDAEFAIVIAGDTLLPNVNLRHYISSFAESRHDVATFAYALNDINDCVRRGMFRFRREDGVMVATEVVEKPKSAELAPSNLACAPVYMLKKNIWGSVDTFVKERYHEPLETRDAPGLWLGWLVKRVDCRLFEIGKRIDIGGLVHYYEALWELSGADRAHGEPAVGRAHPRIGLLGNPSDGYGGKVIGVSVASEGFAQVVATESDRFVVHCNSDHELEESFANLGEFVEHAEDRGLYYGARTLVLAAVMVFAKVYQRYLEKKNGSEARDGKDVLGALPNCQLTYSTTIPTRVGLSGSSAIVLATLRALARFFNTSLEEINNDIHVWPVLMRSAEADILGISCGLQDRVVQVMQGCVAMDFTEGREEESWERLSEDGLPELWIAYAEKGRVGESSGKVHGSLKERYLRKDPVLLGIIKQLVEVADSGRQILYECARGSLERLGEFAALINKNFELRLALVGAEGIGEQNMKLVSTAKGAGFAAKMTGSGGCALCIPDPIRELTEEEIEAATKLFKNNGFVFHKVVVLRQREWKRDG